MFTGIIEALGTVRSIEGGRLVLEVLGVPDWHIGESVAVNGCCLTVTRLDDGIVFDLSPETLERTALGRLGKGSRVNIERAMRADGRFGGHIVQGHVDTTGRVVTVRPSGNSTVYCFEVPREFERYLIDKGSVAVDGVSLTVTSPRVGAFEVWVIPHTLQETNLRDRVPGDLVNLEFDLIAKYIERLTQSDCPDR